MQVLAPVGPSLCWFSSLIWQEKNSAAEKQYMVYAELMSWTHPGFVCVVKLEISFPSEMVLILISNFSSSPASFSSRFSFDAGK